MIAQRGTWLGWAMLAALALHAVSMGRANLTELLWSCHVASTCLALGILFGSRTAVAAGFLFHLAIGFPAWIVEIVVTRGTFGAATVEWNLVATSTLVHLLPIAAGVAWLGFPRNPLPRPSVALAWLIQVGMILPSRLFTPPEFNVNLAHGVWPPVSGAFPRLWLFQAVFSLVCLASLLLVAGIIHWRFRAFSPPKAGSAAAAM